MTTSATGSRTSFAGFIPWLWCMGVPRLAALMALLTVPIEAQAPRLDRVPVQSSDLASVGYDETARVLEIEFRSGGIYRYLDVPKDLFTALLAAESKGKFFAARIRSRFKFERVKERSSVAK